MKLVIKSDYTLYIVGETRGHYGSLYAYWCLVLTVHNEVYTSRLPVSEVMKSNQIKENVNLQEGGLATHGKPTFFSYKNQ